jgi:hypothetical protein
MIFYIRSCLHALSNELDLSAPVTRVKSYVCVPCSHELEAVIKWETY